MKNLIVLLLFWSFSASAFTLAGSNPNLEGWNQKKLSFQVNTAGCPSSVAGALEEALLLWNSVPTSRLRLQRGDNTSSTTTSSPPTVVCSTTFSADTGADGDYVPGAGVFSTSGNRIVSGILYLNVEAGKAANINNLDATTLAVIVAHELGHVFGLGHSEETSALMYYDASAKKHLALHQDDIDGISYLYPRNEIGGDPLMGCGSVGSTTLPPYTLLTVLVLMMLPLLVLLAVRKKGQAGRYSRI